MSTAGGGSGAAASHQLSLVVLMTVLVGATATAAGWGWRRRAGERTTAGFLPPLNPSKGGGSAATNLRHLRDFVMEEVLSDEAAPAPDGFTVFLGRFAWQAPGERALLKLRPQHLPSGSAAFQAAKEGKASASSGSSGAVSLLDLLPRLGLQLTLESGAEYGYYRGSVAPRKLWLMGLPITFNVEVIAPASDRQVVRARVEEKFLVRETGAMYRQALGPLSAEIRRDGRSIQWVYNILDKKKEAERIIFEDPDPAAGFLLVPDPKWKTHPDPAAAGTDRAQWRGAPWVRQLACLAICHDRSIGSLRDLRRKHLPLLRGILTHGRAAIERVYGVEAARVRVFVHYVPQFFHFHVHFSRVHVTYGVEADRAHLLEDVIENIERGGAGGGEYYEEATISYAVKKSEDVYKRLESSGAFVAPTTVV